MKKSIASILALIMLISVGLTGCSSEPTGTPTTPSGEPTPAGPSRTDLNLALRTISTIDPQTSTLANDVQLYRQIYEGLVFVSPDGVTHPRIAESWEQSDDGLTYTFKIRDGIKFHNGEPVTVEDCVFALERGREQAILNAYVEDIDTITAVSDDTLEIKLKRVNSAFFINIAQVVIVSKKAVEDLGDQFAAKINNAGTGPYKLVEYDPNVKIVAEKYEDYYRETGNIEKVTFHIINEAATQEVAFESGELDFIEVPTSSWNEIRDSGKYSTTLQETARVCRLCMNTYTEGAPTVDRNVRLAIMHALDKQTIIDVAMNGLGVPADVFCNPKFIVGSSLDGVTIYDYNPEKSKQILKDAGYADGVDVGLFLVPNARGMPDVAQVVHAMLAEVGIRTTIDQADSSTASARSKVGDFGLYMNMSTMVNHMSTMYRGFHSSALPTQVAKYNSPELDKYLEAGAAATTVEEMNREYAKVNQYVSEIIIDATLFYQTVPYAWDQNLDAVTGVDYYYIDQWNWL